MEIRKTFHATFITIIFILASFQAAYAIGEGFTYDANGNMIQGPDGLYYEYNDANQLKRVRDGGPMGEVIAEYWYDYTGKRIKKNESGVVTYYWFEDFEQIYYPNGTIVNITYYSANGERLAKKVTTASGSKMYYFHPDHLGSTTVVSDEAGNLVEETEYYPYGSVKKGGEAEKYLFTGKELDKATGLYDYGARQYNPDLARFVQPDSVIPDPYNPQALNRYSYVYNNPVRYTDPTGNVPVDTALDAASFIYSSASYTLNPSEENRQNLAWDVSALALPYVPGTWAKRGAGLLPGSAVAKGMKYMPSSALKRMGYSEGFVKALKGGANVVDYAKTSRGTVWLQKGYYDGARDVGRGLNKITGKHGPQFKEKFGNAISDKDITAMVMDIAKKPLATASNPGGGTRYLGEATYNGQKHLVMSIQGREGDIINAYPVDKKYAAKIFKDYGG